MKLITIYIPEQWLEFLDDLVKMKKYPHRADAIRNAIRDLIYREHPNFKHFIEEEMKKHAKKERPFKITEKGAEPPTQEETKGA